VILIGRSVMTPIMHDGGLPVLGDSLMRFRGEGLSVASQK
jgi:hypothetical protein